VDGRGGLMLYGTQSGAIETIDLQTLLSLSIQQVNPSHAQFAVA